MTIDYVKIADARSYYENKGYRYAEVPWIVPRDAMLVTSPDDKRLFETFPGLYLVASGEQSFIAVRKDLLKGRYVCATPCFRDEAVVDELRRRWFFKVELIDVYPSSNARRMEEMLAHAMEFFSMYGEPRIVDTDIGKDIFIGDVEVGSYGIRSHDGFDWVYGTGCAEPRLSQALEAVE